MKDKWLSKAMGSFDGMELFKQLLWFFFYYNYRAVSFRKKMKKEKSIKKKKIKDAETVSFYR